MEVSYKKSFSKNLKKCPHYIQLAVFEVLKTLISCDNLETSGLDYKPMEGQKKGENYFRIRVGNYRLGIELREPNVVVITVMARGDIYKHFPPK